MTTIKRFSTSAAPLFMAFIFLQSCGPSAEEIKQREKAIADSIAAVYKAEADEKARLEEEERKRQEEERKREEEYNKRPEVIKQKLLNEEKSSPLKYLKIKFNTDYAVFSGEDIVTGRVYNNATLAYFKDIKGLIHCYSKTKTLIKSVPFTVYEYVAPNGSKEFKIKYYSPKGTKSIGMEITGATAE